MSTFRKYLSEKKIPTAGMVKKLLKSLDFENIHPEFFDVEKKNTDAGMGGYDYLQITFDKKDALSPKRASDVKLALMSLSTKYGADTSKAKEGVLIIEDANFELSKKLTEGRTPPEMVLTKNQIQYRKNVMTSVEDIIKDCKKLEKLVKSDKGQYPADDYEMMKLVGYIKNSSRMAEDKNGVVSSVPGAN